MYIGLLCLEVILIIRFYVLPQLQARHAPVGHWEQETPLHDSSGVRIALLVFLALIILGNCGLVIRIWQGFKDIRN